MTTMVRRYPSGIKMGRPSKWEKQLAADRVAIRRSICQESFWEMCHIFWYEVVSDEPVYNWHMRIMADELQKLAERVMLGKRKKYDLLLNVPPGSTKSTFASILYLPWIWTRAPWMRYLNFSFENGLVMEFGEKARNVITSDLYRETFPEIIIRSTQDTKLFFANNFKGERRGTSIGGAITGRHAHIQVGDDPIDPEGAMSEAEMLQANRFCTVTLPSRVVSKKKTPLAMVGQRVGIDDPYGAMLKRAKHTGIPCRHICLPADIRSEQKVRPRVLKNKYTNGLLDPKRHGWKELKVQKYTLGDWAYAGQYDQMPIPASGGLFQVDKLVIGPRPPKGKFSQVIRWWDKAASKEKWAAYSAGVLMGVLKDPNEVPRFWIIDVIRERWDTATRERMIKLTAQADEVWYKGKYTVGMEQEPGSGGKDSAQFTVWNLAGFHAIFERSTGDKIARADAFSTQVNAGNVGLVQGEWNSGYINRLKYFSPVAKDKDEIDASSGAFNKLARKRKRAGGLSD